MDLSGFFLVIIKILVNWRDFLGGVIWRLVVGLFRVLQQAESFCEVWAACG